MLINQHHEIEGRIAVLNAMKTDSPRVNPVSSKRVLTRQAYKRMICDLENQIANLSKTLEWAKTQLGQLV